MMCEVGKRRGDFRGKKLCDGGTDRPRSAEEAHALLLQH